MPSDNTIPAAAAIAASHYRQPPQAEALPCPRCDSKNTKFCYYNNYNLSQPRHFCKSCRRYWTHGGTLRNVPVGGGTRKSTSVCHHSSSPTSNKRPRSFPSAVSPCSSSAVSGHDGPPGTKLQEAGPGTAAGVTTTAEGVDAGGGGSILGSGFTSQLSPPGSNTFLALGGYGPMLDGFGRGVWPFVEAGLMEGGMYGSFHGAMVVPAGMETWHMGPGGGGGDVDGGEGGSRDGEGLVWPELAISMPVSRA